MHYHHELKWIEYNKEFTTLLYIFYLFGHLSLQVILIIIYVVNLFLLNINQKFYSSKLIIAIF